MQRWAAQKMITARKQGSMKSGAGRAMGMVFEDRIASHGSAPNKLHPINPRVTMSGPAANGGTHYTRTKPAMTVIVTSPEPREDTTVSACEAHKVARRAYLKHGNRR